MGLDPRGWGLGDAWDDIKDWVGGQWEDLPGDIKDALGEEGRQAYNDAKEAGGERLKQWKRDARSKVAGVRRDVGAAVAGEDNILKYAAILAIVAFFLGIIGGRK